MIYDHEAIRKAFPEVTGIVDGGEIKLSDGTYVTIGKELDQKNIDIAREQINADYAKVKYKDDRKPLYPPLEDFADAMYWNSKGDSSKLTAYYAACEKVKTDNPKPS